MEYYWWIIISLGIVLIGIAAFAVAITNSRKKSIEQKIRVLGQYENGILKLCEKKFLVTIVHAGHCSEVTINSRRIIDLSTTSGHKLIGISQTDNINLIVVCGFAGRIKRYVNENEMEFITYKDLFWNMYVCNIEELELLKEHLSVANNENI